jgi:hypothetical protein
VKNLKEVGTVLSRLSPSAGSDWGNPDTAMVTISSTSKLAQRLILDDQLKLNNLKKFLSSTYQRPEAVFLVVCDPFMNEL